MEDRQAVDSLRARDAGDARRGTCFADCLALLPRAKVLNHREIARRYYRYSEGWHWNSNIGAYLRKRNLVLKTGKNREDPPTPSWKIVCGEVKSGGNHAVIARGKRTWLNPATFDATSSMRKLVEVNILRKYKEKKQSRDHRGLRRR